MKVVYTENSRASLRELIRFLIEDQGLEEEKVDSIVAELLDNADDLGMYPQKGQIEEYLEHLGLGHRRIVVSHCKVIYRIEKDTVFVTDFFDTRQSPKKMKRRARKA